MSSGLRIDKSGSGEREPEKKGKLEVPGRRLNSGVDEGPRY